MTISDANRLSDLLAHGGWAHRLAAQLASGGEPADLLQQTWVVASSHPAPGAVPLPQWLAGIMRNLARMGHRAWGRQRQREQTLGALVHGQAPSRPDELAEKVEAQRRLAEIVLGLAPIYRDVILLRFFDDLSTNEIAARLAVPPGTARRRLVTAVEQLRTRLQAHEDWRSALALLAATPKARRTTVLQGASLGFAAALALMTAVILVAHARGPQLPPRGPAGAAHGSPGQPPPRFALVPATVLAADPGRTTADQDAPPARAEAAERYQVPLGTGPLRGPAGAKVTIIEFVDYQCAFTARAQPALEAVLARHAAEVRFQVIQRPLAFHPQADWLARAALAADAQHRFWPMHARLMARARELWTSEMLRDEASAIGLDPVRFAADIEAQATRALLTTEEAAAESIGVEGVPLFFLNGRPLVGADAPARMDGLIAEEVAYADRLLAAGARPEGLYNAVTATGKAAALVSRLPGARPTFGSTPASRSGGPGFEVLFTKAGSCMPPLAAPAKLDFAVDAGRGGRRTVTAWSLSGSGSGHYQTWYRPNDKSATLESRSAGPEDFVAEHQTVIAAPFVGKQLRFRVEAKSDDVEIWAGIFLRVEGEGERIVTSQRKRLMPGDLGWHDAEVTVAIPADARALSYGLILAGPGKAAMRNLAVEVVR